VGIGALKMKALLVFSSVDFLCREKPNVPESGLIFFISFFCFYAAKLSFFFFVTLGGNDRG